MWGDDDPNIDHRSGLALLSLPIAVLVGIKLGSRAADAPSCKTWRQPET